jgi:hypothetical protein
MSTNPENTNSIDVRQAPVSATEYVAPPPLLPEELEELKNTPEGEAKDALWKKVNAQRRERAAREAAKRLDKEGGSDSASVRGVALGETPEQRAARETKERRAKFGIDTLETPAEPQQQSYLIDRFLPKSAVILVVGDSPSLFLIQLGLCVASGTPFLGRSTPQGKVLFVEYLTDPAEFKKTAGDVARYLNVILSDVSNFLLCTPRTAKEVMRSGDIHGQIREERPVLTIINSLGQYEPHYQTNKSVIHTMRKEFSKLLSETDGSIILSHHYIKHRSSERITEKRMAQDLTNDTCGLQPNDIANFAIYLEEPKKPSPMDRNGVGDEADDDDWAEDHAFDIIRRDPWGTTFPVIAVEREEQQLEDTAIGYEEIEPRLASKDKGILDLLPDPFYRTDVNKHFLSKTGSAKVSNRSVDKFLERVGGFIEKVNHLEPNPHTRKRITEGWQKVQPAVFDN